MTVGWAFGPLILAGRIRPTAAITGIGGLVVGLIQITLWMFALTAVLALLSIAIVVWLLSLVVRFVGWLAARRRKARIAAAFTVPPTGPRQP